MKLPARPGRPAFTLIELMAVITIIVILAGLVVGGLGFVNERQAKEKAKVQIALLSKALEEYKLDNGTYPPTPDVSSITGKTGSATSSILYKALYKNGVSDSTKKIYLPELDPGTNANPNKQGWTSGTTTADEKITDPWGNEYCYRTAFGEPPVPPATGTAPVNASTQNPDFDLWSMGKDGKTDAANPSVTNPASKNLNKDDIRNF